MNRERHLHLLLSGSIIHYRLENDEKAKGGDGYSGYLYFLLTICSRRIVTVIAAVIVIVVVVSGIVQFDGWRLMMDSLIHHIMLCADYVVFL